MQYKVARKDRSHYVIGLRFDPMGNGKHASDDTLLIYHYEAGDVDTLMKNADMMFGALYDLFQTDDSLKDGDVFETEFGDFVCSGIHVVGPIHERAVGKS